MDRKVLTVAAFGMRFEGAAVQLVIDGAEPNGAEVMYVMTLAPDQARALNRVSVALVQMGAPQAQGVQGIAGASAAPAG